MDVTIEGDTVTVDQYQIVPATNGTEWVHSVQEFPVSLWNAHKEILLDGAKEVSPHNNQDREPAE